MEALICHHEPLAQNRRVEHNAVCEKQALIEGQPNLKHELQCGLSFTAISAVSIHRAYEEPQTHDRANHSIERTANGGARLRVFAEVVPPLSAAHVKR